MALIFKDFSVQVYVKYNSNQHSFCKKSDENYLCLKHESVYPAQLQITLEEGNLNDLRKFLNGNSHTLFDPSIQIIAQLVR